MPAALPIVRSSPLKPSQADREPGHVRVAVGRGSEESTRAWGLPASMALETVQLARRSRCHEIEDPIPLRLNCHSPGDRPRDSFHPRLAGKEFLRLHRGLQEEIKTPSSLEVSSKNCGGICGECGGNCGVSPRQTVGRGGNGHVARGPINIGRKQREGHGGKAENCTLKGLLSRGLLRGLRRMGVNRRALVNTLC